jgi:hypothetical protein
MKIVCGDWAKAQNYFLIYCARPEGRVNWAVSIQASH